MVIHDLAVQALDTFVRMNVAFRCNRLNGAFVRTDLARVATHFVAAQPVEYAEAAG